MDRPGGFLMIADHAERIVAGIREAALAGAKQSQGR